MPKRAAKSSEGMKAMERPVTRPSLAAKRSRPPGLKEIAAYLNLSPATVSIVLNRAPLANALTEETRARVLAAARKFNYRPNLIARALSKQESRTIGVIAPESSDGYFTRVMRGIEGALLEAGYLYLTASHLGREDLIREYPTALAQRGVDGLIFINTPIYEAPGVPAASVSHMSPVQGIVNILVDQRGGMDAALRHLHGLGHRRILVMRGLEYSLDAEDRWKSVVVAARRLGLSIAPELQVTLKVNQLTPEGAFETIAKLLKRPVEFTAICAFNDVAAIGTVRALADAGLRCPEDISVLGVDDVGTAAFLVPRLTTMAQPLEAMGAAAVEHLLARIQQPAENHPARVMFPMTLVVRESTGAVKARKKRARVL